MAMLWTVFSSSSFTPGLAISWKWMGLNRSPMILRPDDGNRWCTSATRPAMEFSTGIMPNWQSSRLIASNASSNVGCGTGSMSGKAAVQASWLFAPSSP